ncbi:MAG: pyroglutamyl-peptidase I [Lachnospiraceae bacterium]|nr:pyroglutamyl-peptidase I [Lachnospiraceae bacterium]MBQ9561840.1 pyroglutamyl-peptidase I [Lachnospiraceae bacterium]MBR0153526.1 pyroglutamyl-peptidase I [Lachnospiraceae bacterium]
MVVLVTGFEPFGGDAVNPTQEIVHALPAREGQAEIVKLVLPVEFVRGPEEAVSEIRRIRPDAVICLGLAGGREAVTPERTAVNVMDARIPDAAGYRPKDQAIRPGEREAYFTALPYRAMIEAVKAEGVPAKLSESAGTYVCNCLMYEVLRLRAQEGLKIPCGFVHVPYLDTMGKDGQPSLSLDEMVRAVLACIRTLAA